MNELETARKCRDTMWEKDAASQAMGMRVEVTAPGTASAEFIVRPDMVNGFGICHGGYLFALADSAFAFACNAYDQVTVASSGSIEFIRPARLGDRLRAVATEAHRGGRTGVYEIVVSNQDKERVALFTGRSYATGKPILI